MTSKAAGARTRAWTSPRPSNWEISPETRAWHAAFAEAVASRDAERYVSFFHENGSVQMNNVMPIYSKLAIEGAYDEYLAGYRDIKCEFLNLFGTERQSVAEGLFTYTLLDGSTEVVQHAYVLERDEAGLITSVRMYGDTSRILKPFKTAND